MEQLSTRVVYRTSRLVVREDEVRFPDGSEGTFSVVHKRDFALVMPRENNGFWLVEQFRYPVGRRLWEFPMGSWPPAVESSQAADRPAEDLARAELVEETGLVAGTLTHLGHLNQANAYSTQGFDVFLATDLVAGPPQREASEADMVHAFFTDDQLTEMVTSGTLVDAATLAALLLWRLTQR